MAGQEGLNVPSTYIAYWASNAKNFQETYIIQHIANLKSRFKVQQKKFEAKQQQALANATVDPSGNFTSVGIILSALDSADSGDTLEKIITGVASAQDANSIMETEAQKIMNKFLGTQGSLWAEVQAAYKNLQGKRQVKKEYVDDYVKNLEKLVDAIINAKVGENKNLVQVYKDAVIASAVQNLKTEKTLSKAATKAKQRIGLRGQDPVKENRGIQRAAALVIDDFMEKTGKSNGLLVLPGNVSEDIKKLDATLGDTVKRTIVMIEGLKIFDFENETMRMTVKHSKGKDGPILKGKNDGIRAMNELAGKNKHAFISIAGATAFEGIITDMFNKLSSLFGSLPGIDDTFDEFQRVGKRQYISSAKGANLVIDVEGNRVLDPMLERFLKDTGKQTVDSMFKSWNKADLSSAKTEYGISAKTDIGSNLVYNPKTGKITGIKILDESPLSTIIVREAGLGAKGIYNTIQLAMGHGVDEDEDLGSYTGSTESDLNMRWEAWKNALLSSAFINALTGNEGEGAKIAYEMIYNGKIYHMRDIINTFYEVNLMGKSGKNGYNDFGTMMSTSGVGLNRYAYQNVWTGDSGHDMYNAVERSNLYSEKAAKTMYQTKIRIMINAAMMDNLYTA